jgi:hypothetical protein
MEFSVKGSISFEQDGKKITLHARDFREEPLIHRLMPEGHPRTETIFIGRYIGLDGSEHEVSFHAVQDGGLVYVYERPIFEAGVVNVENNLQIAVVADTVGGKD